MNKYTFILDDPEADPITLKADRVSTDQFGARLYVDDEQVAHVRRYMAFWKERDRACRCCK